MATIYKRGGKWYLNYSLNGKRVRKSVSRSKKIAKLALAQTEVNIGKGDIFGVQCHEEIDFDALCKMYLENSIGIRQSTRRRYDVSTKNLLKHFAGRKIKQITTEDVEHYMTVRSQHVEPATINRDIACLKHMFRKAVEWGYLSHNHLQVIRKLREPPGRTHHLNVDEIQRLLEVCADHLKPIVMLAVNTGMRKAEILNLKWKDVDFTNKRILISYQKNNEFSSIPMNDTVIDTLKALRRSDDCEYVFVGDNGKPYTDIKRSFKTALIKAGIEDFTFHDLRHCYGSLLAYFGTDARMIQDLMRHKDSRMTARYVHLHDKRRRETVQSLGKRLISVSPENDDD